MSDYREEQANSFDLAALRDAYYDLVPNPDDPSHQVDFGTSGHRGSSLRSSFNEAHILAITQAVCEFRAERGITGPLFLGKDPHALSGPASLTALGVLAANGVHTCIQAHDAPTPTPVISHSILSYNAALEKTATPALADGIVITPSHNPPQDGGFKYNETHGGPADTITTEWIKKRANALMREGNREVKRCALGKTPHSGHIHAVDLVTPYVKDLADVIDMKAIARSGLALAVDPLGGASLPYWEPIAKTYGLNLTVVNDRLDPSFSFMPPDHDGKIRMDCSSPHAMKNLIALAGRYDLAFANDPDADRHGIVAPSGLMPTNHYLSAAVWYLLHNRPGWPAESAIGKTAVTTRMIDRICAHLGRKVYETPVGFKWFGQGMRDGSLLFGCEESAGGSFVRFSGAAWSTDKDGLIMDLLAAEMTAVTGTTPDKLYRELTERFGEPHSKRIDAPATPEQKAILKALVPGAITRKELAGSPIEQVLTTAQGNGQSIGGLKVITGDGWFAARPSGTEDLYKIYAESFLSETHLDALIVEAQALVAAAFK